VDELKLWENIKKGDPQSLNRLHALYFHQMCLFARKTVNDNQLIENIVSDCFIKLWENRKKIEIKTSFKSYLYRVLRNQIIDHYRGKQENAELLDELPDIPNEIEFDEQQRYAKLYKAISKLPEQRRKILELAVFDSLSYQQIATKLGISKNTVKTQMARAYRFLKESLEPRDFYFFCLLQKKL
jgi:RNA polymerase sigma-70 factor (family 1)